MVDPKLPSAKRRLATFLRDEELGPKLVRLNRADERVVLDLIYENRGREARAKVNQLDAGRREVQTTRSRARRYIGLDKTQRSVQWLKYKSVSDSEFWDIYRRAMGLT